LISTACFGSSAGMRRLINILDVCLALAAAWFVLPLLITGDELELPLPFGNHITAGLSERNLLILFLALWIRLHLRLKSGEAWLTRFSKRLSPFLESLLIGAMAFLLYSHIGHFRAWPSGDTISNKLLPISILERGDLNLDEFVSGIPKDRRYCLRCVEEHEYSIYPVGTPLTALPVYAFFAAVFPKEFHSWTWAYAVPEGDNLPNVANFMEQFTASWIGALAVVVFWLICLRVTKDRSASLWFTVAYGVGTSLLSTASLALWQHGPASLFLGLMFLFLLRSEEGGRWPLVLAGLFAGWASVCRPTTVVVIAGFVVWVLWKFRFRAIWFLFSCAVPVIGVMILNWTLFGNVMGGYGQFVSAFVPFNGRAMLAILFSPSRGLFLFSPFLLFALGMGLRRMWRSPLDLSAFCLYAATAAAVFFSCWSSWSAGSSFGSRYLCESALILCLILPLGYRHVRVSRPWRDAFILAVLLSCYIHLMGARHGDHEWTVRAFQGDDVKAAWQWRDSQLIWTLIGGRDGIALK
jgi:hypothetical protein